MNHPKMQYTYVGIDSHKETHTAVFLNCFFEKLGEIQFDNIPSDFDDFIMQAQAHLMDGTVFLFGMEDCASYGRMLMVHLTQHGYHVKHVNALLVARERKNQNTTQKTDSIDAECAARVLLSKFDQLPDAVPEDKYWALRALVTRRALLVKHHVATQKYLHGLLSQNYPKYRSFFSEIDGKTSMAFFKQYPSPGTLQHTSAEELAAFLELHSNRTLGMQKAIKILDIIKDSASAIPVQHQSMQDSVVQSAVRQLEFTLDEVGRLEDSIETFLTQFDCTLTSMVGIDTVTAAQILACVGNIKKFSTPARLARYAGIAPVTYASGRKDIQFSNQRGNRELNSVIFWLAVRVAKPMGGQQRVMNSFFYDYYNRKVSEGKTKRQALKCVQRRLVNIIWTMLYRNEDYINPPAYDLVARANL